MVGIWTFKQIECIECDVRRGPKVRRRCKLNLGSLEKTIECCTQFSVEFARHPGKHCEPSLGLQQDFRLRLCQSHKTNEL